MQTAQTIKCSSGFVEITHPFHPLKGKKFKLLRSKVVSGQELFSLQGTSYGTFSIPRSWTDKANSDYYFDANIPSPILNIQKLNELLQLISTLRKKL